MIINYIYLLQEREFVKTKETIYKVGMTKKENYIRFNQYPNGSILLFQMICNDCNYIEKEIINILKKNFTQKKDIGREYFEGNFQQMIDIIYNTIKNNNDINNNVNNNINNNVNNDVNNNINNDINNYIKNDVKNDINNYIKNDVKNDVKNDIKNDVKNDVKNDIKNDINNDVKNDVKNDLNNDLINDLNNDVNNDLINDVNNDLINDVNNDIKKFINKIEIINNNNFFKNIKEKLNFYNKNNFIQKSITLGDINNSKETIYKKHITRKEIKNNKVCPKKESLLDSLKMLKNAKNYCPTIFRICQIASEQKSNYNLMQIDRDTKNFLTSEFKIQNQAYSSAKKFICKNCNKIIISKHNYDYHVNNNICQKIKKEIKCNLCNRNFKENRSLLYHIEKNVCNTNIKNNTNNINNANDIQKVVDMIPFKNVKYNISLEKYLEYAKYPEKAIKTFIKDEHFNPNKPERMNILNTNLKSKKVQVLDCDDNDEIRWIIKSKTDINKLLYDRGVNHLYVAKNILEENGIFLDAIIIQRLISKINEYETNDKIKKEEIEEISDLTYNYRDIVDKNKKNNKLL